MTIREIILQIIGDKFKTIHGIPCRVTSVDIPNLICDCEPINGDADIKDVRLMAGTGNGATLIPAVDSIVIVQMISDVSAYVSMFSQLSAIKFLDGSFAGLVKVNELVTKLNRIEDRVNVISTWGGTVSPPLAPDPITATVAADIENDKITHGNI